MKSRKAAHEAPARTSIATTAVSVTSTERKPWKKKTPVELIIAQVNKLRDDVTQKEEELAQSKKQLQRLDEVLKANRINLVLCTLGAANRHAPFLSAQLVSFFRIRQIEKPKAARSQLPARK